MLIEEIENNIKISDQKSLKQEASEEEDEREHDF